MTRSQSSEREGRVSLPKGTVEAKVLYVRNRKEVTVARTQRSRERVQEMWLPRQAGGDLLSKGL